MLICLYTVTHIFFTSELYFKKLGMVGGGAALSKVNDEANNAQVSYNTS